MSLNTLITTVQTKTNSSRSESINFVYEVLNLLPNKFSKNTLETTFNQKEFFTVVETMQELRLIHLEYHYECQIEDDTYTSEAVDNICNICKNELHDLQHEISTIYHIKKSLHSQILEECTNLLLEKYLKSFSRLGIELLKEQKQFIIPFYGAGLSMPLGFPSWGKMLTDLGVYLEEPMRPTYDVYIKKGDYLKALEHLKYNSMLNTESIITEEIVKNFKKQTTKDPFTNPNNYLDLVKLAPEFYVTTNYDNVLTTLITKLKTFTLPYTLDDLKDIPALLRENENRVIHLHGNIQKPETMIVTEERYEKLYKDDAILKKLAPIMASKSFLFLGFSFQDKFFTDLFQKIIADIGGTHFIILPNITLEEAQAYSSQNLRVIAVNVAKDKNGYYDDEDYAQAIRSVLKVIN
ncbi:SIR2 family protein [Bacillus cereus]|uniref:SIR2 family protein n=1 Tax=Bacillus cereus TaxID=1396 RepID=UPI0035CB622B